MPFTCTADFVMPVYDLAFARKFAEVAEATVARGLDDVEAHRVVAYISRLSMELSLKAFLERVGVPVAEIKRHWHDLRSLLAEVEACQVEIEISAGVKRWLPASREGLHNAMRCARRADSMIAKRRLAAPRRFAASSRPRLDLLRRSAGPCRAPRTHSSLRSDQLPPRHPQV